MKRYIVTRTLKVVNKVTGELVHALDKHGNTIPIAGYWVGPGRTSILSRRYSTTPGAIGPDREASSRPARREAQ
jgi:hypothetical protein